jgi:hypothetical protein
MGQRVGAEQLLLIAKLTDKQLVGPCPLRMAITKILVDLGHDRLHLRRAIADSPRGLDRRRRCQSRVSAPGRTARPRRAPLVLEQ